MSSFENGWALTLIVFLPAVGAAAVLAIPKAQEEAQKWTALLFAGVSFVLSVIVAFQFDYGRASEIQFGPDSTLTWIGAINSNYAIGIDGIVAVRGRHELERSHRTRPGALHARQ